MSATSPEPTCPEPVERGRRVPRPNTGPLGKVARLPFEIREELCRRMRDGEAGPAIIAWLESAVPAVKISPQNLSNWRLGGYKDWLSKQERCDQIRDRAEDTRRNLEAGGFSVLDQQIYELAGAMTDVEPLKAAAAIAALKNAVTAADRAKVDAQRAKIAADQAGLSREKFQRDTCELFLRWFKDERARQIASSNATNAEKIEALRAAYFADVDALDRSGEVELPK